LKFIFQEQQSAFKENLTNTSQNVQDDIVIRCESLKEDLEQLKQSYHEELDGTEKEIYEYVLLLLLF